MYFKDDTLFDREPGEGVKDVSDVFIETGVG